MADEATLVFKAETQDLVTADERLNKINKTGKQTDNVVDGVNSSFLTISQTIRKMATDTSELEKTIGLSSDELVQHKLSQQGATKAQLAAVKAIQAKRDAILRSNAATKQAVTANKALGGGLGRANSQIQNTAFQLQDIVVQLEGGVAPSRALGQQLPQLLGGFGALGAVAGVVAGLGFALGGPLVNAMIGAKDGSKELEGALEDLDLIVVKNSDGVFELTERIKELEGATKTATLEEGIQDAADAADALSTKAQELRRSFGTGNLFGKSLLEISGVESEIIKLGISFESGEIGLKEYASSFDELFVTVKNRTKGLRDYRQGLFELSEQLSETEEKQKSISSAISGSSDVVNENQSSIDRLIDRLVVQAQAANDSANSTAFYKAQQLGATEAEIERVKSLQGVIDKQKDLAAAEAKAASDKKAADAKVKAEKGSADKALEGVRRQLLDREGIIADNAKRQLDIVKKNEELLLISAKESADLELEIEADKQKKLEALRKKEEESKSNFRTTELTAAGDFLTLIGNISGAENKKQFERNKKLRVAGATISGIAATVDAYRSGAETNIFVGAAYAAIAAAATGAQIAQIKNQQYPGRAIGGQVTDGQAYRVGEFGPETFVPSSSGRIIPTGQDAANDGRMVEVVNNIKVIGGDENAQVTTTTTQQSDRKVIQDIVVDLMRNQSSPARQALQQTSNVVPRGTR